MRELDVMYVKMDIFGDIPEDLMKDPGVAYAYIMLGRALEEANNKLQSHIGDNIVLGEE